MSALFTILVFGFIISMICMVYLVFCSYNDSKISFTSGSQFTQQKESNVNWLSILLFATGVFYVCCLVGASVHFYSEMKLFSYTCQCLAWPSAY